MIQLTYSRHYVLWEYVKTNYKTPQLAFIMRRFNGTDWKKHEFAVLKYTKVCLET